MLQTLEPRWDGPCIVAATGKSLTKSVAATCVTSGYPIIAVKQAIKRFPDADVMYALDAWFWDHYEGCPEFSGEKWSGHCERLSPKIEQAKKYGLHLVRGLQEIGFSTDPSVIHWGRNSGFQAINLAIHWLRGPVKRIIMVGFDFSGGYFFGEHPLRRDGREHWSSFLRNFDDASKQLPLGVEIVNASPVSLLSCFPRVSLETALSGAR